MKNSTTIVLLLTIALLAISAASFQFVQVTTASPGDETTATATLPPPATQESTPDATIEPPPTATSEPMPTLPLASPTPTVDAYFSFIPTLKDIPPPSPSGCVPRPSIPGYAPAIEREMAAAVNNLRLAKGKTKLRIMPQLVYAARRHALDMTQNDFVGHDGSDSSTVGQRVSDVCYQWIGTAQMIGLNAGVTEMRAAWANSPANLDTMLSEEYLDFGVTYVHDPHSAHRDYWVVVYGRPSSAGIYLHP